MPTEGAPNQPSPPGQPAILRGFCEQHTDCCCVRMGKPQGQGEVARSLATLVDCVVRQAGSELGQVLTGSKGSRSATWSTTPYRGLKLAMLSVQTPNKTMMNERDGTHVFPHRRHVDLHGKACAICPLDAGMLGG
ncbi:hypothetical protein J1614_007760 [Plenodomus biglobosus]|nr:hypothetical protein J1614_007760 [Plenodomus biglobosus]